MLGDLKPDYVDLIAALDGQVITLGRGRGYLNVLDITLARAAARQLGDGEHAKLAREVLADAVGRRHTMVSALISIQRGHPPTDREDSMLAAALRVLDERHPGTPVLADLLATIESAPERVRVAAFDRGSIERYRELVEPLQVTLQALLGEGRVGEMFSRPSTVSLDLDRPAVFDVSSIPEDETELVGAALSACWGVGFGAVNVTHALAEAGLAPMRHYLIILDELWRALIAGRGMVDRTNSLTRLNRQWGVGVVMCSHTIKDLLSLPDEHERMKALGLIERSGHADLRRAPARGDAAPGVGQGSQRRRAAPADLLAGPARLVSGGRQRRAAGTRELHDQDRRAARHPVPGDAHRRRAAAARHQQALARPEPPRRAHAPAAGGGYRDPGGLNGDGQSGRPARDRPRSRAVAAAGRDARAARARRRGRGGGGAGGRGDRRLAPPPAA